MEPGAFLRGAMIGFAIAAPVGPIGVLCIRRTLVAGRLAGFVSGLGAAVADATYGAVAALGLTTVSAVLVGQQQWLRLGGGMFLIVLGARTLTRAPALGVSAGAARGLAGAFLSTCALTLANPATILSFAAIFAALGATAADAALPMVAGVFAGSALWWLTLSTVAGALRGTLGGPRLVWINRLSGPVFIAFGVAALASLR